MTAKRHKSILSLFMAVLLALSFITNLYLNVYEVSASQSGTVIGNSVNVRSGPGTGNPVVNDAQGNKIQLNEGHSVNINGSETATDGAIWYLVQFEYNGNYYSGYMHGQYISINPEETTPVSPDTDFEAYMVSQGFPESYKESLRKLHAQYPAWVFQADHLDYDFEIAAENESIVGRSLIAYNSISSWKSLEAGSYDWENGTWYSFDGTAWAAASKELVSYCMDPRNFLDSTYIFQFEALSFNTELHTKAGVEKMIISSFMENNTVENGVTYTDILMQAAETSQVSPYHLAARIIQEVGRNGGSQSISGTLAGYENLYNYYNQGAYAHDGRSAIENGLIFANTPDEYSMRPWNTRTASIIGGAKTIGKNYINAGQDTLYYQKFDFVGTPYTHQYMTHILAPSSEAVNMSKAYTEDMKSQMTIVFKIPVYKNMPSTVCAKPTADGSPNNVLKTLSVDGYALTPTFSKFTTSYDVIVNNSVTSVNVSGQAMIESTEVTGLGKYNLEVGNNTVEVKATAENGTSRTYTINVIRLDESGAATDENNTPVVTVPQEPASVTSTICSVDADEKNIYGIQAGTDVQNIISGINVTTGYNFKITDAAGADKSGIIKTGDRLVVTDSTESIVLDYSFVVYGDVTGDGEINSLDMLYLKRHILGINVLSGAYLKAGDANRGLDGVNSLDMLYVKRHILGINSIAQ